MTSQLDYRIATLHPRLSDWRGAGYRGGLTPPDRPATITFPAGVTVLTTPMRLQSGDVLRGAGRDQTILRCPSLFSALGQGTSFAGGKTDAPGYSTGGGWIRAEGGLSEIGIEDLTIEFPAHTAAPHFYEQGYNATFFGSLTDSWVRRVRIVNADSVLLCYRCANLTFEDVELRHPSTTKNSEGHVGHYGIMLGRDCTKVLVSRLSVTSTLRHDTDVANGAHHNVVERSTFADYACSQHGGNPHHNLFTEINAGLGSRFWFSGGAAAAMPHNGPGQVFWNVRKTDGSPLSSLPAFGSEWRRDLAIVGHAQNRLNTDLSKEWVEQVNGLTPPNVYRAQRGELPLPAPLFPIGRSVTTTAQVNIRSRPALASPKWGTQPTGAHGVVRESEVMDAASGFSYVRVDFQSGVDGYCGCDKLT